MMNLWKALSCELDAWADQGRAATLWLRDDDAQTCTPALERLISLADRFAIPMGLAVIPQGCSLSLESMLRHSPRLNVLQHGYAHKSHALANEKKAEYGDHRAKSTMLTELARGHGRLRELFPQLFLPVLVPPWNRISESLVERLPSVGFEGLSTYQPRRQAEPFKGLAQSNCHADIIDWRGTRAFVGESAVLEQITTHLRRRRYGEVDNEATGLLAHHLNHDEACWSFLESLFEQTHSHSGATWLTVSEVMWNR